MRRMDRMIGPLIAAFFGIAWWTVVWYGIAPDWHIAAKLGLAVLGSGGVGLVLGRYVL
jgi:hypothetical protein